MNDKEQFEIIGDGLLIRAPAKINLSLLIAGKRPDGFHDIETIMAKVNFYDELLIEQGRKSGIELICKGPHWAPEAKENLVNRAAEMLLTSCGRPSDIKITLTKNIPAGSGLGSVDRISVSGSVGSRASSDSGSSSSGSGSGGGDSMALQVLASFLAGAKPVVSPV